MKTILPLMCGLFLISQISFGKEMNTKASAIDKAVKLERITFKNSYSSKKNVEEMNRIWLNLTNAGGAFKQSLVGYVLGATNGFDKLYDGVSIDSNPYIDFYSIDGGRNLTIQGRGLPFLTTDEVPLGYKTNIVGAFQISIDHVDGLFVTQDIFLEDKTTGVIHNLKNGAYSFTTLVGRFNDRFVLRYVNTTVSPAPPVEPVVTVPVVPTPVVTEPVVTVPVVPTPVVTEPVVTVPVVPTPVVTEPVVTVPVVPTPVVTEPVVTVPVVPTPVVTEPVVTVPVVPTPVVTEPVVTVPVVPTPVVTDPVVTVPVVPTPVVTDPVVTVPVVPTPVVTEPVVTVPVVPTPVVTEPVVTVPVVIVPAPFAVTIDGKVYGGKGKSVIVSVVDNQITINSVEVDINEIYVYNMGQMQLFGRKNINDNEFIITDLGAAKQVLIIKTQLKNGKWTTSKVIL
nr:hypothetical protein [uncultured Flavobacterium sp.]